MRWKDSVNSTLHRLTGYALTKETAEERQAAMDRAARRAARVERMRARHRREVAVEKASRQAARRARQETAAEFRKRAAAERERRRAAEEERRQERERRRLQREAEERERRARGEHLPRHLDDQQRSRILTVHERTMTGAPKLEALIEAVRYVVRQEIPGHVVECGVWRGGSMQAVALTLLEQGDASRELHLFDTFEGMPPPTDEDTRTRLGRTRSAEEMLAGSEKDSKLWAVADLDDVRKGMEETGYPTELIHYHVGLVEDTTPDEAPDSIALLRLDTDWYASTKHELEHLYERLSPGGVLILDDFGDWDGARKATHEWLAATGEPIFLAPMGPGRIGVKPFSRTV